MKSEPLTTEAGAEILTRIDMSDKFKRQPYRHERPDLYNVKLKEVQGYEIWITPHNHFFVAHNGVTAEPRERVDGLVFDPPMEGVPQEIIGKLCELLEKQHSIRARMVAEGEYDDDEAWNWS